MTQLHLRENRLDPNMVTVVFDRGCSADYRYDPRSRTTHEVGLTATSRSIDVSLQRFIGKRQLARGHRLASDHFDLKFPISQERKSLIGVRATVFAKWLAKRHPNRDGDKRAFQTRVLEAQAHSFIEECGYADTDPKDLVTALRELRAAKAAATRKRKTVAAAQRPASKPRPRKTEPESLSLF